MAAQPPTGPMPSNDGSSIFRRGKPKKSAQSNPDELQPDEVADLIDMDPESIPLDQMPRESTLQSESAGSDVIADEIVFADEVEPVAQSGDSSVNLDMDVRPTAAGEGWFEDDVPGSHRAPSGPPSTDKFEDAAHLFADLSGNVQDSTTNWIQGQGTGRVSENELMKAFDEATRQSDDHSGEFDVSELDPEANPRSSIFGKPPERAAEVDLDDLRLMESNEPGAISDLHDNPPLGGSSIFARSGQLNAGVEPDDDAGRFGFELPEHLDPTGASNASGRIDLNDPGSIEDSLAVPALSGRDDLESEQSTGAMMHSTTAPMPLRSHRSESQKFSDSRRQSDISDEDESETTAGRASGGWGKFIGGTAFGLLAGGVAFAGLYLGGVIPNGQKEPAAIVKTPSADPDMTAKLGELQKQIDEARQAATTQKQEFDKQLAAEQKDAADAKKQVGDMLASLTRSNDSLAAAKADAETARKELIDVKKAAETATTELTTAKKDAATLKAELDTTKMAAETALMSVESKRKAAEDTLAGVVTELKSAKLLGPDDDASKLPAAVKQLATVAGTGDSQKAAEAILTARKEIDTLKANLKSATDEALKAKDEAAAIRTSADKQLAETMKNADDKVKAAVEAATKESSAALAKVQKDLETAKATARAEAEAVAKKQIDEAVARATAAETARIAEKTAFEQKLADQTAQFNTRLTEAKSGATVRVTSAESAQIEKAARSYATGLSAFEAGRLSDAEAMFAAAATGNSGDARYWYFLGLSRYVQGKAADAEAAFKKGAELEARGKPNSRLVSESFERLPLSLRGVVKVFRP